MNRQPRSVRCPLTRVTVEVWNDKDERFVRRAPIYGLAALIAIVALLCLAIYLFPDNPSSPPCAGFFMPNRAIWSV